MRKLQRLQIEKGYNMKNYYDFLEVHPESGQEVIESSYKALYKLYDPDSSTTVQEKLSAKIRRNQLKEAYNVIGNPKKREKYDKYFKAKGGKVELDKNPNESMLIFFAIAVIIVVLAKFIVDTFFPNFVKLTHIISSAPIFQGMLAVVLFGIAIHYLLKRFKR